MQHHAPAQEQDIPTPWHTLTYQEMGFARTHTDLVLRLACKALGVEAIDPAKFDKLRADIEDETRNLLFVQRGAATAAWLMEMAERTGKIIGYPGNLSDLQPSSHERMQRELEGQHPGHASIGPRHPIEPGIPVEQEPKFTIKGGRLVNRQSGKPIPADEPIFILRARDCHAIPCLMDYLFRVSNDEHRSAVQVRLDQFQRFAANHPDRMHEPDTTVTHDWPGVQSCNPVRPPAMTAGKLREILHPMPDPAVVVIDRPNGGYVPLSKVEAIKGQDVVILKGADVSRQC